MSTLTIILLMAGSAVYAAVGLWRFMDEMFESSWGQAFGWFGTPVWIIALRAVFWPLFLIADWIFIAIEMWRHRGI